MKFEDYETTYLCPSELEFVRDHYSYDPETGEVLSREDNKPVTKMLKGNRMYVCLPKIAENVLVPLDRFALFYSYGYWLAGDGYYTTAGGRRSGCLASITVYREPQEDDECKVEVPMSVVSEGEFSDEPFEKLAKRVFVEKYPQLAKRKAEEKARMEEVIKQTYADWAANRERE